MDQEQDLFWDAPCCTVHLVSEALAMAVLSSKQFPGAETSQQTTSYEATYTYNIYKAEAVARSNDREVVRMQALHAPFTSHLPCHLQAAGPLCDKQKVQRRV